MTEEVQKAKEAHDLLTDVESPIGDAKICADVMLTLFDELSEHIKASGDDGAQIAADQLLYGIRMMDRHLIDIEAAWYEAWQASGRASDVAKEAAE